MVEDYSLPGDLERQIEAFVDYYDKELYHESSSNITPADAYFGCGKAILRERKMIKKPTKALTTSKTSSITNYKNETGSPRL